MNRIKKEYSEVSDKDLKINQEYFDLFQNELNGILINNKKNDITIINNLEIISDKINDSNKISDKPIFIKDKNKNKNKNTIKNKKTFEEKKVLDDIDVVKINNNDILAIKMLIDFFRNKL